MPRKKPYAGASEALDAQSAEPLELTTVKVLRSGGPGDVNALDLRNPSGGPMLLEEIRWELSAAKPTPGGLVGCSLNLGGLPLTNGTVPIWGFSRLESLYNDLYASGATNWHNQYAWRFDRPLYLHEGETVVPTLEHFGLLAYDVTVRVTYAGRALPIGTTPPETLQVPYAAVYKAPPFALDGSVQTATSSDRDLANPFGHPLHVERFVGRYAMLNQSNSNVLDVAGFTDAFDTLLSVWMTSSRGVPMVKKQQAVPFRHVFNRLTRSWEVPHLMEPRSHYILGLATAGNTPSGDAGKQGLAHVTMVGWRDVPKGGDA